MSSLLQRLLIQQRRLIDSDTTQAVVISLNQAVNEEELVRLRSTPLHISAIVIESQLPDEHGCDIVIKIEQYPNLENQTTPTFDILFPLGTPISHRFSRHRERIVVYKRPQSIYRRN